MGVIMPIVKQKGQETIPENICALLKIREGDEVIFEIEKDDVIIRKRKKRSDFQKYLGIIQNKTHSADELVNKLRNGE
jgi:bifunctional DNA-binding transcriptional regulator/antitoxin component of YhaV-PrlF toxin-antitoxin module